MTQATIPRLSLFNKTRSKSQYPHHDEILSHRPLNLQYERDLDYIYNRPYIPVIIPSHFQREHLNAKKIADLQYLNSYYDSLNKNLVASSPDRSNFDSKYYQNKYSYKNNPTLTNNSRNDIKKAPAVVENKVPKNTVDQKKGNKEISNNSSKVPVKPTIEVNVKQDHKKANLQIINAPISPVNQVQPNRPVHPSKNFTEHDVQTDQLINNKSIYIIEKPAEKMDNKTFRKTIGNLSDRISSVNLDIAGDDVVIDIADLIQTKEQYIEQSNGLLRTLNLLAEQKWSASSNNHGKNQKMVWPDL